MEFKKWTVTVALLFLMLAAALGTTGDCRAAEPWADDRLTVTDGLLVWLDAAALPAAHAAAEAPALEKGDPIDVWPNAIEAMPDFAQAAAEAQPTYRPTGDFHAIHFESPGQHLRLTNPLPPLESVTVFIVAAPYSSPEAFSAFLSMSAADRNDFQTGLNIDQAVGGQSQFDVLNVEGTGSQGVQNLLEEPLPFGTVTRMCVTSTSGKHGVSLWVDGVLQGTRNRVAGEDRIHMDEVVVGGRYYGFGGPSKVQGFLHGDIAEVLIFDRALSDMDRAGVEEYLADKYGSVGALPLPQSAEIGKPLVRIEDSVPVQVFVPGFTAHELPVDMTNVNNVQYREDGVLFALGYDGRIWQMRDTDGDGLEDRAELFWENESGLRAAVGMDLTPPGYQHGDGVFIVGKTRCLLIVDTDGDDRADQEIEVAGGWQESFHGVDGLGVAFDPRDGSVYYGRGTQNFTDPLLRDEEGRAKYTLEKESGVIIRVAPDFKTREIFATGIRFPVAIRFNRNGDLFCTDQEGATWVPNGNPLDELLHVRQARHYGFPPRHPKYVPDVIDEPSTFDYGPQHQSTCGFCFNVPVVRDGPTFGPPSWEGDALVTGYSRGKLYRTEVTETASGYVARNHLFACLDMLTADCCIAPDGSLVVACHSGGPDWGSGPTGTGKLYKIRYSGTDLPQPVLAWPSTPREVRVEFDRPVDPELLHGVLDHTEITAGEFVRAGDRFETLWPGYAAVLAQQRSPRREIRVHSAQLTPDRRTLVFATDSMKAAVHYAIVLPGMGRPAKDQQPAGALPQFPQIDLAFDLSGVEASWSSDGEPVWNGWLPSVDLALSRQWTTGSAHHDRLWTAMEGPGELILETQLELTDMLRPAVQPGSTIDYELPAEQVVVAYESSVDVTVNASQADSIETHVEGNRTTGTIDYSPQEGAVFPIRFQLTKRNDASDIQFAISYSTQEDRRARPLQIHRTLMPWADKQHDSAVIGPIPLPAELEGGSWARGRKVFFGAQAGCAKCHAIDRQGGDIGPDLSNLIHRDYTSVIRDIAHPSFAINPDYVASSLLLSDGRILNGVLRTEGDKIRIGDKDGKTIIINRDEVEELRTSPVSVMPEDILETITAGQTRDLLTCLLGPVPSMPRDYPGAARPTPRSVAEVNAVLAGAPEPPENLRPIRIVLVAGPKDHGPGEHDYPAWQEAWQELLSAAEHTEVSKAWEWPTEEQFESADVIVFYQHGDWDAVRAADVDQFLKRGGGLVYVHWAVDGRQRGAEFAERIGLAGRGLVGFRHGDLTLAMNDRATHPVLRNFSELALTDESYWKLVGDLPADRVLATSVEDGRPQPQVWSLEPGRGRVFVSIPGHYSWTFDDPLFRVLLFRGIAWAAKEPVDRFNELVWPGADVAR